MLAFWKPWSRPPGCCNLRVSFAGFKRRKANDHTTSGYEDMTCFSVNVSTSVLIVCIVLVAVCGIFQWNTAFLVVFSLNFVPRYRLMSCILNKILWPPEKLERFTFCRSSLCSVFALCCAVYNKTMMTMKHRPEHFCIWLQHC